jgi:hypothetical protein
LSYVPYADTRRVRAPSLQHIQSGGSNCLLDSGCEERVSRYYEEQSQNFMMIFEE